MLGELPTIFTTQNNILLSYLLVTFYHQTQKTPPNSNDTLAIFNMLNIYKYLSKITVELFWSDLCAKFVRSDL